MLATTLIVFREMLEAALIIGIVLAATRGALHRGLWVSIGVGAGLLGALVIAASADVIASAVAGVGQEVLNATVLFLAVGMLGWHNIWMKRHGRELSANMHAVGREMVEGERPLYLLAVVVGIAVLREGSEVVLFLHGIAASTEGGTASMLSGGLFGIIGGGVVGFAMYFGLLRIPARHLFTVTAWLILLLAAGMSAQGAHYLVQAGLLPPLGTALWDTSRILSEHSVLGQILHTLVGYIARPDGIQVIFYFSTLFIIGGLMQLFNTQGHASAKLRTAAGALIMVSVATLLLLAAPRSEATQKIYSPHIEQGELELEVRSHIDSDADNSKDGARKDKYEIGYGFTEWWFSSLFVEYEKSPGGKLEHEATAWENIFLLSEPGQYWLDSALYLEYEVPKDSGSPDKLEMKLLLEKTTGSIVNTANIILEREIGSGAANITELGLAWRTRYRMQAEFEPGIEFYGDLGKLNDIEFNNKQKAQLGPVIAGKYNLGGRSKLGYEVGYLFGLNSATPDGSVKWLLEYEYLL